MKNNRYRFSCLVDTKEETYSKPIPHPKWWRRMLGQTYSTVIPKHTRTVVKEIQIPSEVINETWFVETLQNILEIYYDNPRCFSIEIAENKVRFIIASDSNLPMELEGTRTNLFKGKK